jgi:outer membrane murein-binding lipoprotein Lpp
MERRKILLGSGAALVTVLAGCSSDETDDQSPTNGDDSDESLADDGDGTGDGDGTDDSGVPGLNRHRLEISSETITIMDVNKDDDEVDVVATTTTTDPETLRAELDTLAADIERAITDPEAFAAEVNSVTWVLEHDGAMVMSFYVDVEWAIAYAENEIGDEEFTDRVLETVGEHE